jgi:hypothetical protein
MLVWDGSGFNEDLASGFRELRPVESWRNPRDNLRRFNTAETITQQDSANVQSLEWNKSRGAQESEP